MNDKPLRKISPKKYRGLGDLVAVVAEPVARVIDAVAGTRIQGCAGCARRRDNWNRRFQL